MDDPSGGGRSGIRHRGERRFSLARIGPGLLAFEIVLVLLAGLALFVHEHGREATRTDDPSAAGELPTLLDPTDSPSATGTADATSPTTPVSPSDPGVTPATGLPQTTPGAGPAATTTSGGGGSTGGGSRPTTHTGAPHPPSTATSRPTTPPRTTRPPTTPPRTTRPTRPPVIPTALPDPTVAAQLVNHLNGRRMGDGCPALKLDNRLSRAAQGHASDMVRRHFFRHTNPDGLGPADRAAQQGWSGTVGEDIALGYENAARAVDGWWSSPSQHDTLTTCSFRSIGVGYDPGQALSGYAAGSWVVLLG